MVFAKWWRRVRRGEIDDAYRSFDCDKRNAEDIFCFAGESTVEDGGTLPDGAVNQLALRFDRLIGPESPVVGADGGWLIVEICE